MWPGDVGGLVTTLTCAFFFDLSRPTSFDGAKRRPGKSETHLTRLPTNNSFWAIRSAKFEHVESITYNPARCRVLGSGRPLDPLHACSTSSKRTSGRRSLSTSRRNQYKFLGNGDQITSIANNAPTVRQNVPFQRRSQVPSASLKSLVRRCSPRGCFPRRFVVSMSLKGIPSRFEPCPSSTPRKAVGSPLF
jgi:hypothetical protein